MAFVHVIVFLLALMVLTLSPIHAARDSNYFQGYASRLHNKVSGKDGTKHRSNIKLSEQKYGGVVSSLRKNFDDVSRLIDIDGDIIRASTMKASPGYEKTKQVIYLHFHKAGGTSICRYFKDSNWKVPEKFCICNEKVTNRALFAHTRKVIRIRSLDKMFKYSNADICMFEKRWMMPMYFFQLRRIFRGSLVTTLRLPWDRFRSNYEKDYSLCRTTHRTMTIEQYAKLNPRDCRKSYYLRTNTNRPNFYVRMLNGLSIEQYSFDGDGDGGLKIMTNHHLEQAKEVLLAFDVILFLEEDPVSRDYKLQKLTGSSLNLTRRSNNPFSDVHKEIKNETKIKIRSKHGTIMERKFLPPTEYYRQQFEVENDLDMKLYMWAYNRFAGKA